MISKETIAKVKETIADWSGNKQSVLDDLRTLVRRIGDIKGNKSFRDSIDAIEDVIDELLEESE